jgi:hypothetical protein
VALRAVDHALNGETGPPDRSIQYIEHWYALLDHELHDRSLRAAWDGEQMILDDRQPDARHARPGRLPRAKRGTCGPWRPGRSSCSCPARGNSGFGAARTHPLRDAVVEGARSRAYPALDDVAETVA